MSHEIPSASALQDRLRSLTLAQLQGIADQSGVPFGTLHKIRYGQTLNPGIDTVRKFIHLLPAVNVEGGQVYEQGVTNA